MRRWAVVIALVGSRCGAPPPAAPPPPPRLDAVASDALTGELRELGYRIGARAHAADKETVVAWRDGGGWYLALGVESSVTESGPKVLVRLSVFSEPSRQLRGEVAPYAIDPDGTRSKAALARMLGARAAEQFAENFSAANSAAPVVEEAR